MMIVCFRLMTVNMEQAVSIFKQHFSISDNILCIKFVRIIFMLVFKLKG